MKRQGRDVSSLVILAVLIGSLAACPKAAWGDNISTPSDLSDLAAHPERWSHSFVQTADIDMASAGPVGPIGTFATAFTGTYDGQGHSISNVLVLGPSQAGADGLFGIVRGTSFGVTMIQKLVLKNPTVVGASEDTGGLVGRLEIGTLLHCAVQGGNISGGANAGGLVGQVQASAVVQQCSSTAFIVQGAEKIGGLIGWNAGRVENCFAAVNTVAQHGDWPQTDRLQIGGLVGFNYLGRIASCYANCDRLFVRTGAPTSLPACVGGLVGRWWPGVAPTVPGPANYCAEETADAWKNHDNAVGCIDAVDANAWVNLVAVSVPKANLQQQNTFVGWDFTYVWAIAVGGTPTLK